MEILITGASGFLGKFIVDELKDHHTLKCLSRSKGEYIISLENEVPCFNEKFDIVIHAAGKAHNIPKTILEKNSFNDVNVKGTSNLLKGLEKKSLPEKFIFISSVAVYGQDVGNEINEEHILDAKDPYGLSKIEAENLIIKWCVENNIICTILRLPLIVGEEPLGNLQSMLQALDRGYYFNIGGGKARKSMVLAKDVAAFIKNVASVGGIYNLTDGYHPNFYELSTVLSERRNKRDPLTMPLFIAKIIGSFGDFLGDRAPLNSLKVKKITSNLTFDDNKARLLLDWQPESVLDYIKNNDL